MRLTNRLYAQHLGWMFKKHWEVQGKRIPIETGAVAELESRGIPVKEYTQNNIYKKQKYVRFTDKQISLNLNTTTEAGPEGYIISDNNILLEGLRQAQILTKTILINELPKQLQDDQIQLKIPNAYHKNIQNLILSSCIFDTEQVKTAIMKVPEKPAFVLPRNYSISEFRKSQSVVSRLLLECEKLAGKSIRSSRKIVQDANLAASFIKDDDVIHLDFTAQTFISSNNPIQPIKNVYEDLIPDLHPVKHTITIPVSGLPKNYSFFYPFSNESKFCHPHTIVSYYTPDEVKNLHETPVTTSQFHARTLLKAFATAVARANQLYPACKSELLKPILVQSIQTDGKTFHFGVFQLNTLNLNGTDGIKNYWFNTENINLYNVCEYQHGIPKLDGYNEDVFKLFNIFYNNR